jgi:hypothetical protein
MQKRHFFCCPCSELTRMIPKNPYRWRDEAPTSHAHLLIPILSYALTVELFMYKTYFKARSFVAWQRAHDICVRKCKIQISCDSRVTRKTVPEQCLSLVEHAAVTGNRLESHRSTVLISCSLRWSRRLRPSSSAGSGFSSFFRKKKSRRCQLAER